MQKIKILLGKEANIRVIAPQVLPQFRQFSGITIHVRKFSPEDLQETDYLIVATGDKQLAKEIHDLRLQYPAMLACFADFPELGNIYTPAVLQFEDLSVAVSSNGLNPKRAANCKNLIAQLLQQQTISRPATRSPKS